MSRSFSVQHRLNSETTTHVISLYDDLTEENFDSLLSRTSFAGIFLAFEEISWKSFCFNGDSVPSFKDRVLLASNCLSSFCAQEIEILSAKLYGQAFRQAKTEKAI